MYSETYVIPTKTDEDKQAVYRNELSKIKVRIVSGLVASVPIYTTEVQVSPSLYIPFSSTCISPQQKATPGFIHLLRINMTKTSPYISGAHIPGEVVGKDRNITGNYNKRG